MNGKKSRVLVAMSGGVDSSVAAALLLEAGYEVIGATMQLWPKNADAPEHESGCCALSAVEDARRTARQLGIAYYVLNFQDVFEEKVIRPFILEYKCGRTPNPCIACNQVVKFEHLMAKALALDCRYLATGHYARIVFDESAQKYRLCRGIDAAKDQSYFLYRLKQRDMRGILFPLGKWTKKQVRDMAAAYRLSVAAKAESQEICFVINNEYRDFLRRQAPDCITPGNFVDLGGKVLGRHEGIAFYTVGQRKGLGLQSKKPLYVVDIRPETNIVVVGEVDEVYAAGLKAGDLNWVAGEPEEELADIKVKIRSTAPMAEADVCIKEGGAEVIFKEPQRAVTPGQAAVFYRGDCVLGGGTILGSL
ncbi:MAG: tRNA 2-thiouridine(34) synthase MnmA [Bacillota bacterium]